VRELQVEQDADDFAIAVDRALQNVAPGPNLATEELELFPAILGFSAIGVYSIGNNTLIWS
jgi:hypothetical protein